MDFGTQGPQAPAELAWLRGVDAYTMGAYPQAEEEFRAAVRIDPTMADGWLGLHALRVDTTNALLRMFRNRDRFGEQRARHRRTLNSWYWLGWWVQPVLENPRDLLLAHASHWLDGRHVPELDRALAGLPPVDSDAQVRFLHACRAYLVKDWEQLVRHTDPLLGDPLLGIEAGLFSGMARVRLEMYGQAEPLLSAALMRCRSEQPQRKELRYWLARAHEGTGRSAAALPLYRAVHRVDPAFMDSSARLAAIAEGDGYDDPADLEQALAAHRDRACVIVEPVQGEGGVRIPRPGYLGQVRALCRTYGALLVVDEIQTGMGRLGTWWGVDAEDVRPDVLLVGKGLSGGVVPVAAMVATAEAYAPFSRDPYLHTSTFGASPIACAAALATVRAMEEEDTVARAAALGPRILTAVRDVCAPYQGGLVREVRGRGLLIGIEFAEEQAVGELMLELISRGVLVNNSLNSTRVLRLTPPAVVEDSALDLFLTTLGAALRGTADRMTG